MRSCWYFYTSGSEIETQIYEWASEIECVCVFVCVCFITKRANRTENGFFLSDRPKRETQFG